MIRAGKKDLPGLLLDVSRSGLSVHSTAAFGQGDELEIVLAGDLRVPVIAWHARRARNGFATGMMLSSVPPEYERFVTDLVRRHPVERARPTLVERPPPESWWRLRVKEVDGPRTRVVTLTAASRDEAVAAALREIGPGWDVLEARPASRPPLKDP